MKVTVSADGEVSFDTEDVGQAMEMVRALRNGAAPAKPKKSHHKKKPLSVEDRIHVDVEEVPLSAPLVKTWQYMVEHGSSSGVSVGEVARGLNLKDATAGYRLRMLVKKGLAHHTQSGFYAPGEES
jgi:hypothetical protein